MEKVIEIDYLSSVSLHAELYVGKKRIGQATCFGWMHENRRYIITNWHVLTGTNAITNKTDGAIPQFIVVWHHHANEVGTWRSQAYALEDERGNALWLAHPKGRLVDVVAIPADPLREDLRLNCVDPTTINFDMRIAPAMPVQIIGFPLGISAGGKFPVWKTGHIASEPDLDIDKSPVFLIDATTRGGMSGSPVFAVEYGAFQNHDRQMLMVNNKACRFLGVYSGRLHPDSEIGQVWKPRVITDIITNPQAP